MEKLFELIWTAIGWLTVFLFLRCFLSPRERKWYRILLFLAVPSASFLLREWNLIFFFLLCTAGGLLLFQGNWYWRIIAALAGCLLTVAVPKGLLLGMSEFYGLYPQELRGRHLLYTGAVTTGTLLALLSAWILLQFRSGGRKRRPELKWVALMLLFPFLSIMMLMVICLIYLGRSDISENTFFFCCLLQLFNVAIIVLISATQNSTHRAQEMALLHKQLNVQTESIVSLERSYRAQRQTTHDYQNQLQTIWRLLSDGSSEAALSYVSQLLDLQSARIFSVNSHHPIVDAVINQKYQTARENGIEVTFQVSDLSGVKLPMNTLVVLLSNLLDNAIEGCMRLEEGRAMECSILWQDSLFLSIRNTAPPVVISGNSIPTSKEPKADHGFGLLTIRHILDDYGAEYTFRYEDGWFQFAAEIPDSQT